MKNLDIEKLERKNIYKTPDNFFEEMQKNVLQETTPKKEGKIVKLNWAYSAAAAVALLFGITFFINQNNTEAVKVNTHMEIANNGNDAVSNSLSEIKPQKEATVAYQTLEKDLANSVAVNQKESTTSRTIVEQKSTSFADQKNTVAAQNPEVQVDQVLANFTSAELADLGKNAEQDVYLDLYN